MHNGQNLCYTASSCPYHLQTIISQLLNKSHTKMPDSTKNICQFSGKMSAEWTISRKMMRQKEPDCLEKQEGIK